MYEGKFSVVIEFRENIDKGKDYAIIRFWFASGEHDPESMLPKKVEEYCRERYETGVVDWMYEGTVIYPDGTSRFVSSGDIRAVLKRLAFRRHQ